MHGTHVHFHGGAPSDVKIVILHDPAVLQALQEILTKMAALDAAITKLQADVAAEKTVEDSAVTLLQGLSAQLAAALAAAANAGATPAQLQALTDLSTTLEANTTTLSAAVTANTPAAP